MIQKEKRDLYSGKRIQIPAPCFVVFYNGTEEQPERKILRLSESFYRQTEEAGLELTVLQLNINPGQISHDGLKISSNELIRKL